jgi:hypothetical protein
MIGAVLVPSVQMSYLYQSLALSQKPSGNLPPVENYTKKSHQTLTTDVNIAISWNMPERTCLVFATGGMFP